MKKIIYLVIVTKRILLLGEDGKLDVLFVRNGNGCIRNWCGARGVVMGGGGVPQLPEPTHLPRITSASTSLAGVGRSRPYSRWKCWLDRNIGPKTWALVLKWIFPRFYSSNGDKIKRISALYGLAR